MKKTLNKIILNNIIKEEISPEDFPYDVKEEIADKGESTLYKCENNHIFTEDNLSYERVDLEDYYGVSSEFNDTHYEDMPVCPICKTTDIEKLGTYTKVDIEDLEESTLNEYDIFTRIAGPKRKEARFYAEDLNKNLFPLLEEFGMKIYKAPTTATPSKLVYSGNLDGKPVQLIFITSYEDNKDIGEQDNALYCKVSYLSKIGDVGYIQVDSKENADIAFTQITKILEELGYKTEADIKLDAEFKKDEEEKESLEKEEEYLRNEELSLPPKDLLSESENNTNEEDIDATSEMIINTLKDFDIEAEVVDAKVGPTVTLFELKLKPGTKLSSVTALDKEVSLALSAKNVRIIAPIPGKSTIGIEIPNQKVGVVNLADILNNTEKEGVSVALGIDTEGTPFQTDIIKLQHLLIGGTTSSGKSAFINSLISSILMQYNPNDVKLILIDPKRVELNQFKGVPHLLRPIVDDPMEASNVLKQLVNEMDERYKLFNQTGAKNIEMYNAQNDRKLSYIICVIDELADLMQVAGQDVEASIKRITQLARAAGIHLVVATQRPSTDIVTGTIKSNIPSRISFATSSAVDSRVILDQTGAEKLLGKGDMLYKPIGATSPKRLQGAYTTEEEVDKIVNYYKEQLS